MSDGFALMPINIVSITIVTHLFQLLAIQFIESEEIFAVGRVCGI